MATQPPVHRLQRVIPVFALGMLMLATLAFVLNPAQATGDAGAASVGVGSESATAGTADWPMPFYDAGRTRANLGELEFSAPFDPTPVKVLSYTVGEAMRPAGITDSDMLFWYKSDRDAAGDELVVATDLDGQKLWSFDIPAGADMGSVPPIVAGEEVFVNESVTDGLYVTDTVVALDRTTGSFLWRKPVYITQYPHHASLAMVVQDGIAYLSYRQDSFSSGFLTAVNARTGAVLWDITPDNSGSEVADALAITNNTLVALHSTHIIAYDLATGAELWEFEVLDANGDIQVVQDMVAIAGKVAFANTRIVGALDVTDGSVAWSHNIDVVACSQFGPSQMASDGDGLFIMSICRDQLRRYDLDTGIELWRETAGLTRGDIALANNVVYVNGLESGSNRGYVSAYRASDGQFLQRLDVTEYFQTSSSIITSLEYLAVANGKLMGVIDRPHGTWQGILFFFGSTGNLYLPLFNDDESPDTNPDAPDEVSIVDQDGVYGAEIQVAAQIGPLSATLKIYHAGGGLYKEGGTEPDEHGNGFWIAPLEYTAAGYEYQVILNDGTELPLRQVLMPADPVAGTDYFVQSNGLSWVSPPTTITSAPYTLTLTLPAGFPITTTNAFAMMRSAEGGSLLIPGARVGHQLFIQLDENNAINGEHTFTTAASAGNFTAYGPGITVTLDAPELPDVRVAGITGF